ncbi:TPA: LytR family transcriptional regulator, partial [Listeria monocytogenes]|nr:LytR family transcriptional regulator [Listeria monocytogenes]EAF8928767.1 LytR family transcriptional regulator [Listeria monocytogenes]HEM1182454.1 LytR family transcriptional regulator [Listeria monocytogenes]
FNGKFEAKLLNREKVIISRQYAKVLKQKLNMGGKRK